LVYTEKRFVGGGAQRKSATPKAPPTMARASAPKLRLRKLSPPFCRCGPAVPDAPAAAVSAPTTAKEVMVVAWPLASVEVLRTNWDTDPPPGVKVVTNVDPLASVAVMTWLGVTLESTSVAPLESVVVTSIGVVAALEGV